MESPQQNLVSNVSMQAKLKLAQYEAVREIELLYKGVPNWEALITQEELDSVASFKAAKVTVANLGATIYALNAMNVLVDTYIADLVVLASL